MIAQLFFQVKHLQKKKQDLETPYAAQIGIYRTVELAYERQGFSLRRSCQRS
jgi:hypothetical protein